MASERRRKESLADPVMPGVPVPLGDTVPTPAGVAQTTPGAPGPPAPPPPTPSWQVRAAMLQAEYVAGGGYPFLARYIRSLPHWIDDTTRDFGDDLYERMLMDPQAGSAIRLLKEETLANGVRLEPATQYEQAEWALDEPDITVDLPFRDRAGRFRPTTPEEEDQEAQNKKLKDEAELAEEIADFCEDNLLNLDRPFVEVLYEMLDAVALGNKVAEQVYKVEKDSEGVPRLHLKALKVKPRRSVAFVVDAFMNVIGVLGLIPGQAYPVLSGGIVAAGMDPSQVPNLLPREKFAIFTWGSHGGDPRGTSLLRPVYNPWWLKMQIWGEYAKYLVKFAGPSLIGYTAPGSQPVPPTDSLGNAIPGMPLIMPEQAMLNALLNFTNGTAVVFPSGARVEPVNMQGDGSAYRNAIALFDQQITKGILCQTLATEEGRNMARAAAETHQDVLDIVVLHIKALLAAMIYKDILFPLVKYNWGEDVARRLTPRVHLAQIERHNWASNAAAVAALTTSRYLDPSQYPEMDARLGLPRRSPTPTLQPGQPSLPGPPGPGSKQPGVPMPGLSGGIAPPRPDFPPAPAPRAPLAPGRFAAFAMPEPWDGASYPPRPRRPRPGRNGRRERLVFSR